MFCRHKICLWISVCFSVADTWFDMSSGKDDCSYIEDCCYIINVDLVRMSNVRFRTNSTVYAHKWSQKCALFPRSVVSILYNTTVTFWNNQWCLAIHNEYFIIVIAAARCKVWIWILWPHIYHNSFITLWQEFINYTNRKQADNTNRSDNCAGLR